MLKVRREGKVCEGVREEVVYRDAPTFKSSSDGLFPYEIFSFTKLL